MTPKNKSKKKKPATATASLRPKAKKNESKKIALAAADAALSKKAAQVTILDVRGKVDYADYLVLASGNNDRHVEAIASGIEAELHRMRVRAQGVEGMSNAQWVLMDFGDIVVHVFHRPVRSVFDLEGLWIDAERVPVPVPKDGGTEAA